MTMPSIHAIYTTMPSMQHDIAETTDLENISRDVANRKTGKTFFLKTCI